MPQIFTNGAVFGEGCFQVDRRDLQSKYTYGTSMARRMIPGLSKEQRRQADFFIFMLLLGLDPETTPERERQEMDWANGEIYDGKLFEPTPEDLAEAEELARYAESLATSSHAHA